MTNHPTDHGCPTELWTAPRRAQRIEQEWGIPFHPDDLTTWLRQLLPVAQWWTSLKSGRRGHFARAMRITGTG